MHKLKGKKFSLQKKRPDHAGMVLEFRTTSMTAKLATAKDLGLCKPRIRGDDVDQQTVEEQLDHIDKHQEDKDRMSRIRWRRSLEGE